MALLALLFITLCVSLLFAQYPVLSPPVAITYLGGDVQFTCTKDISMQIAWDTDIIPNFFHNNEMNFSELHSGIHNVTLNNTVVHCVARDPSQPFKLYYSNPAKIVIQGFLSEIAIKVNRYYNCTVEISWDHPFTQPGVPILGYNVNITNLDTNSTEDIFINDTTLNISLGYDYMVSIAGVNNVGEGNETVIFVNSTELTNNTLNVTHIDVYRKQSTWKLNAVVKSERICQNSRVFLKFCEKANSTVCSNTNNITQTRWSNNEKKFSAFVLVLENQHYDITVNNQIGKYSLSSSELDMSTYDIQSVDERDGTNGSICFKIKYVNGSIATGCHVLINCESDDPQNFDIDGYNKQYRRSWCSPKPFLGIKTCSIQAYDKVYEVVESKSGPAVQFTITVTGDVVITTQTSIPSSKSNLNILFIVLSSAYVITANTVLFIIFIIWYWKKNKNKFLGNVKCNTITPQHSITEDTQNRSTTEIPNEFIVKGKEDVLSMSKVSLTVQPQNEETTKM